MSLPRMSWHIGDYKKDTGHLRAAGHGAYFLLSMHYWATGGLPDDDKQLAAIACLTDREWKSHRETMRAFFKGDGVWKHKRIEIELAAAQAKYEKRAEAGSKGGKAKANGKQSSSNATAEPYQPITDNPKEEKDDAPSGAKIAFESGRIRLTAKNLSQWKAAFLNLDLEAELLGLSDWAEKQGSNWFVAVSGALAKRNREISIRRSAAQQGKVLTAAGQPWPDGQM